MTLVGPSDPPSAVPLASPDPAETLHLLMRLRSRGVNDTAVLRAFESVPRGYFMPAAYRDLAGRDLALPIGCGQVAGPASDLALAIAALDVSRAHNVVDIGTGSGYCAAILSCLAGAVVSLDRFRTLTLEAQNRIDGLGVTNVRVLLADAMADLPISGPFQRALIDFAIGELPPGLVRCLAEDAICVFPRPDGQFCRLIRAERRADGGWDEELIGLTRVGPSIAGTSRHL